MHQMEEGLALREAALRHRDGEQDVFEGPRVAERGVSAITREILPGPPKLNNEGELEWPERVERGARRRDAVIKRHVENGRDRNGLAHPPSTGRMTARLASPLMTAMRKWTKRASAAS